MLRKLSASPIGWALASIFHENSTMSSAPLKPLGGKPVLPSEEEIAQNTRARSAKLRVAEKI